MAESQPEKAVRSPVQNISMENALFLECAVCLQNCVHPAELPCGHVFCYLCIKGIVNQGRRCAMCRQDIPMDFLDKPKLLKPLENNEDCKAFEDGHVWFYEGHNGWWQYDERTSLELETAYQNGDRCCELLVAGFLYVADFDSMLQYRRNDPGRRRRIKRDLATTTKKGVAGLKLTKDAGTSAGMSTGSNGLVSVMQNLHLSNRQDLTNQSNRAFLVRTLGRNRSLNRNNSDRNRLEGRRQRRHSITPVHSQLSDDDRNVSSNSREEVDNDDDYNVRNIDLDLDWVVQQIESFQYDLSNDYENFTQDVDNYQRLQNIFSRTNNDRSQLTRSMNPLRANRSLENELNVADRLTRRSRMNRSEENVASFGRGRFRGGELN